MMSLSDPLDSPRLTKLTRNQYILRVGVLGWGIPVAILCTLIQSWEHGWDGFLVRLLPALVLFPLGGIPFGMIMWRLVQRKRETVGVHQRE